MDFNRWNTFWTVCFGVMAFLIIFGNTLSIIILLKKRIRKRPHFLLISLVIADLLVGLCALPIYILLSISDQKLLSALVFHCVDMFTGLSSIFTLAAISLERLNAVARPLRHRQLPLRSYTVAIAIPWIVSIMVTSTRVLLSFFVITTKQFLAVIIVSLSAPLLIACVAYYIICRKQASRIHNEVQARREAKLSRTLFLITALFVLTWLPFQILSIVVHMCNQCRRIPGIAVFLIKLLQYSNSFINFLIYCLRMPDYRNALLQMLPTFNCCRKRRPVLYPLGDEKTGISLVSFASSLYLHSVLDDPVLRFAKVQRTKYVRSMVKKALKVGTA